MYKEILTYIFCFLFFVNCFSQKEANVWYFGENAGLDFSTGSPVSITDGALNTEEGTASIADCHGNLLFYTDGVTVYNKNHQVMINGSGLFGHTSSTQSAIIVPKPGSNSLYYIFTTDDRLGNKGLRYSIVDMTLQGGVGELTSTKNISLFSNATEKVTAIKHENGLNIWIITHEWNNNKFKAFLLSPTGINTVPVTSSIGTAHNGELANKIGYLKASVQGNKLALAVCRQYFFEVFDFNTSTGIVTNPIKFYSLDYWDNYGVEFSPDETKIYLSTTHPDPKLIQYNLSAGSDYEVLNSRVIIATTPAQPLPYPEYPWGFGAMQIAPDNKIYVCKNGTSYLAVINNPNDIGSFCNYADSAVSLSGKTCFLGLPNIFAGFFLKKSFTTTNNCVNQAIQFHVNSISSGTSYFWNFGDVSSGSQNTSTQVNPNHIFTSPGLYPVTLVITGSCITDTIIKNIEVSGAPLAVILAQSVICENQTLELVSENNQGDFYQWIDPNNYYYFTQNLSIPNVNSSNNGIYSLEVSNSCGSNQTSINIVVTPAPYAPKTGDVNKCGSGFATITATDGIIYHWFDTEFGGSILFTGSTFITSYLNQTDTFWVSNFNGNCESNRRRAIVNILTIPQNPIITQISNTILHADIVGDKYEWKRDDVLLLHNTQDIEVEENGMYSVKVRTNNYCWSDYSMQYLFTIVNESHNLSTHSVDVYPLVVEDYININYEGCDEIIFFRIVNMTGQVVYMKNNNVDYFNKVNLYFLRSGIYFIEIKGYNQNYTYKFIKL